MEITRSLLYIPTVWLLLLLLFVFASLNIFITYIIRKYIQKTRPGSFNELIGLNFTVVSGFYALLMAFVIGDALSNSSDVQKDADKEGSLAKNFYRQVRSFPDTGNIADIKIEFIHYVNLVLEDEYPKLSVGQQSESTHLSFTKLFDLVEQIKPTETAQAKAQFMFQTINELATYRSLRVLAGTSEIPFAMWLTLLVGALITVILSALLSVENFRYHLFVNGLLGAFIGLLFFLILMLNHPFSGSLKTEPTGYKEILTMEKGN